MLRGRSRRPLRRVAQLAVVLAVITTGLPAQQAWAADVSQYDARGRGSLMSFSVHMPQTGVPIEVIGGALDSTARANSLPQAFATAGAFPVPAASSAHLLVPNEVPGLGTPVPPGIRAAFQGIDYTNTPNYCQAVFPAAKEGLDEAHCGGPAQDDPALGFTSATFNGHAKTSGDFDEPMATKSLAESRAQQVEVPGAQAKFHHAASKVTTGLNGDGVPQASATASATTIEILNGIVKLGDVVSETTVQNDGTQEGTAGVTRFSVGTATILGLPVRIGGDGFTFGDQPGAGDPKALTEAVNKAANIEGFAIRLFPAPPLSNENGLVTAQSGGIELSYLVDKPVPARIVQRYAYTWASVSALAADGGVDVLSDPEEAGSGLPTESPAAPASGEPTPAGTEPSPVSSPTQVAMPLPATSLARSAPAVSPTFAPPVASPSPAMASPSPEAATTYEPAPADTQTDPVVPGDLVETLGDEKALGASSIPGRTTLDFRQVRWLYLSGALVLSGVIGAVRLDRILAARFRNS